MKEKLTLMLIIEKTLIVGKRITEVDEETFNLHKQFVKMYLNEEKTLYDMLELYEEKILYVKEGGDLNE